MQTELTTRQVALVLGISEASLERWCDRGILPASRTIGGHRRVPMHGIIEFVRSHGLPLARPEVIGLPTGAGRGHAVVERGRADLRRALHAGDEEGFRRLAFDPWIAGTPLVDVLEVGVVPALEGLGRDFLRGEAEIYEERRAIEICVRFLHEVRSMSRSPADDAPLAIGGAAEHDPYVLPTVMIEVLLRDAGWRTQTLGIGNPLASLTTAVETTRPTLFWMSIPAAPYRESLVAGWTALSESAALHGTATVLGGRAYDGELRRRMPATAVPDDLRGLLEFAAAARSARFPG